jgi:hypothetical protein
MDGDGKGGGGGGGGERRGGATYGEYVGVGVVGRCTLNSVDPLACEKRLVLANPYP